jgi:signal transduction histidine kinase
MVPACRQHCLPAIGMNPGMTLMAGPSRSGNALMAALARWGHDGRVDVDSPGRLGAGPPWLRGHRRGPLRRAPEGQLVGGVAAGLAARTGLNVTAVRIAFLVTALMSGFGLFVYVLAWLFVPAVGEDVAIASRAQRDLRGIALAAATASILVMLLVIVSILGAGWLNSFAWTLVVAVIGLELIWRNAAPAEQARLRELAGPLLSVGADGRSWIGLRASVAALLLVGGLVALWPVHNRGASLRSLSGLLLVVAAIVVLLGPWWLRIARDLVAERQARARAEERADIAAVLHDSVLQTLALIQRRADNPQQVVALARAQERELRSWLFDGRAPGSLDGLATTMADGIRLIQQDVESQHGITVEVVIVGDCPLDEDLAAMLGAAREATVNAAKWSAAAVVSLFAEIEPTEVSVFVRDRGRGFDPAAVPEDRKGLAESVSARMARRGGSATVRSAPGEGAEVSLRMPRGTVPRADTVPPAEQRQPSQP